MMSKALSVPRLRFPEFKDAGGWEQIQLGSNTSKIGSGITPRGGEKAYKETGRPFVRSQNVGWGLLLLNNVAFIDEETHNSFSATEIKENDIFLNISGASIGRSAIADVQVTGGNVNQHVCIIRVKPSELNSVFLSQFLNSAAGQKQIDSFQAGGNRQGLNFGQISSFLIPTPNPGEQQKIADCLTSIDDLITAEAQKLDALETHKKGLMQQLFPADGETMPKLRFPGFKGAWEVKPLGDCLDYIQPTKHLVKSTAYNDEYRTPVLTAGKTFILGYTNEIQGIFADGLPVIIFDDFTTASKFVEFPFKAKSSAMKILMAKKDANIKFIYEAMQIIKYTVGVHERHWISIFTKLNIAIPKISEQQKIAACLTSIDDLITANTQELNALKTHKKGLMQQLFPTAV